MNPMFKIGDYVSTYKSHFEKFKTGIITDIIISDNEYNPYIIYEVDIVSGASIINISEYEKFLMAVPKPLLSLEQKHFLKFFNVPFEDEGLKFPEYVSLVQEKLFLFPKKGIDINISSWLTSKLSEYNSKYPLAGIYNDKVFNILTASLRPSFSKEHKNKVSMYTSYENVLRDRSIAVRISTFIKLFFINITDVELQELVTDFQEKFNELDWVFKVGDTIQDFEKAYNSDYVKHTYFPTSSSIKAISNSCMQKGSNSCNTSKFNDLPHWPTAVYASGDFEIATIWSENKLGARVILNKATKTFGPIYGSSQNSIDFILGKIKSLGYVNNASNGSWDGQRLLVIPSNKGNNSILMAYLDLCEWGFIKNNSITICSYREDICLQTTSGYISRDNDPIERDICESCGDYCNAEYSYYVDESLYCDNCYGEYAYHCDNCSDYHDERSSPVFEVLELDYLGQAHTSTWCHYSTERNATLTVTGRYWCNSHIFEIHNSPGDYISKYDLENNTEYKLCEETGLVYYIDNVTVSVDEEGNLVHIPEQSVNTEEVA